MEKTKISAQVIADSKNEFGNRITSFVVKFPRIILAEFNTHRMFSRNSASSRAIPFKKMLKLVMQDPFIPIAWQKDHKGMQGTEYLDPNQKYKISEFIPALNALFNKEEDSNLLELFAKILHGYSDKEYSLIEWWLLARDRVLESAVILSLFGTTKQICNRLLEAFMWHTVVVTATEWSNFFALRSPIYSLHVTGTADPVNFEPTVFKSRKDVLKILPALENNSEMDWLLLNKGAAEIHAMGLAEVMWDAYNESTPKQLKAGEWHIPFGDKISKEDLNKFCFNEPETDSERNEIRLKVATARCARISYLNFEGKNDYGADIKLHDDLLAAGHMSPFEHCAKAMKYKSADPNDHTEWSGNFRGFIQYRKMLPGENRI